eukprot:10395293-Heterocapsa_arctica.AAC.1
MRPRAKQEREGGTWVCDQEGFRAALRRASSLHAGEGHSKRNGGGSLYRVLAVPIPYLITSGQLTHFG